MVSEKYFCTVYYKGHPKTTVTIITQIERIMFITENALGTFKIMSLGFNTAMPILSAFESRTKKFGGKLFKNTIALKAASTELLFQFWE